ncbi:MAG: adenylate/guanylate cyclase domain-containing protein, partial [Leptospiraceae bacterium]|nr:adenylate/guanylate cyclase domain-containing protein [Leptospiraceae bacterium]
ASIAMHRILKDYNKDKPDEEKVLLCVGLGFGRVLRIGDADVYGSEVNAASKLGEDTAKAWEILVTDSVKEKASETMAELEIRFEEISDIPPGAKKAYKIIFKI